MSETSTPPFQERIPMMIFKRFFPLSALWVPACIAGLVLLLVPVSEVKGATPGIAWLDRYDGPPNGSDDPVAVVMDDLGNVYVTGQSTGGGAAIDFATIKYDSAGNELWVARYDSGTLEGAFALAVDPAGNVYVVGVIGTYQATKTNYLTIKYDADGTQQWVREYDGPMQENDYAMAVAVDAAGNVYVTGASEVFMSSWEYDYATVKYDPDGNELWVARYENDEDEGADAVSVDGAGNVYVTGKGGTVKYDSAGNQLWAVTYDWGWASNYGYKEIALDGAGNVYVAGTRGSFLEDDAYATIKYDNDGNELWAALYEGPGPGNDSVSGLGVDPSGNVYVTGASEGELTGDDYATVKYDSNGNELWVARYDGPDQGEDAAEALVLDGAGNALVTGTVSLDGGLDFATVKYDPTGTQLWVATYNGPRKGGDKAVALAVNPSGRAAVTGMSYARFLYGGPEQNVLHDDPDFATLVYDMGGNQLWEAAYSGEGPGYDRAEKILLDDAGNVYVTGTSGTVKHAPSGARLWTAAEGGLSMALDASGHVLLAGTSKGTAKLDGGGTLLWSVHDGCRSVAVDGLGNVYAAGSQYRSGSDTDFRTIKYDPAGTQLWEAWYDGPLSESEEARHVALDGLGNVVVAGHKVIPGEYEYEDDQYEDYITIKYDSQGNELWVVRYEGSAELTDLAVDNGGNVIATGTNGNYVTVKYDSQGNELWVAEYDGPGGAYGPGPDRPNALAVDNAGNVYVTGASMSFTAPGAFGGFPLCEMTVGEPVPFSPYAASFGSDYHAAMAYSTDDYATVKYDPAGNQVWVARYEGLLGLRDWDEGATDLAVDGAGNVYVTGYRSLLFLLMHEIVTIKYSPSGSEMWAITYDGPAQCTDEGTAIAVNDAGEVFVAGGSIGIGTRKDYVTIRYSESVPTLLWSLPASAEAAGPGQPLAPASGRFGVIFAFFAPLLALALLRRRYAKKSI